MGNINKNKKIAIVSNSANMELYNMSKIFYQNLGYEIVRVSGENGLYTFPFLDLVIRDPNRYNFDWMIYIDEDCFITDPKLMIDTLNYMIENEYDCCGMPDGGVISHRFHNPVSINLFFIIINLKKIRENYNYEIVNNTVYDESLFKYAPLSLIKHNIEYKQKYDILIEKGYSPFGVIYDNFEPYYRLFFWMLNNNMKILYLDGDDANDIDSNIDIYTTSLKNHDNKIFAYHSWFARSFNNQMHNNRIKNLYKYCLSIANIDDTSNVKNVTPIFTPQNIQKVRKSLDDAN